MTTFHEHIRNVLAEVDKFIDSLKGEKLAKKVLANKDKVIEVIKKLREEWPALENPASTSDLKVPPSNDRDVSNESIQTRGSHGSGNADDDDNAYGDNVPDKAAKDLTNALKTGFLEKRRKKATLLQALYQRRFCGIQDKIFYYYEKNKDTKQSGAFYLEGYEFREAPNLEKLGNKKDLSFEIVAPGKRTYQFLAESKEEFQAWRDAFVRAGCSTGTEDIPVIEGELEDIYEEMDEVAEKAKAMAASGASNNDEKMNIDQEVYDDAQTVMEPESDEIYDDVDNVDTSKMTAVDNLPPPLPPPMTKTPTKPSMPLPQVPPVAPPAVPRAALPQVPPQAPPQVPPQVPPDVPPPRADKTPPRPKMQITVNPDEDFDNMYYGKWDCRGDSEEELSFKHGDVIHIISREFDNKDWWVGRLDEKYGLVPKNYLIRAYKAV